MGIILTLLLCIVLTLLVAAMTGFLTKAAAAMHVGSDPYQKTAHNILISASVVGWVAIAVIIAGCIALAVFAPETASAAEESQGIAQYVPLLIFLVIAAIFIAIGVLGVAAAYNIRKGADFSQNQLSYKYCAWVGGLSVGAIGFIIFFYIVKSIVEAHEKKEAQIALVRKEYNEVQADARLHQLGLDTQTKRR